MLQRWPDSIIVHSAVVTGLTDDDPRRAASSAAIDRLVADAAHPGDRFHAAEALYAVREFSRAADLYGTLHTTDQDSLPLRRRLKSLYFADRRRDARALFDSLADGVKTQRDISAIGVAIYERSGLLMEARQLLEREFSVEETLERRLNWIGVCERLGDVDAVRAWLEGVVDPQGAPGDLMSLAMAMDRHLADPRALQIGYRALRLGYGDPQVHLGYTIGLFLMGKAARHGLPAPQAVAPDTAVHLKEKDGERILVRVIETEAAPSIERGEISPDHEIAARLTGLRIGDEVEIENLGLGVTTFVVTDIQSNLLHAHFRSLHDFKTLFPENKALGEFQIDESKGDEKFKPIFDSAKRRAENARGIEDAYKTGNVPIGFAATVAGVEPVDLWEVFTGSPRIQLQVAAGAQPEFEAAHEHLRTRRVAVLDPVTLYGIVQLGLTDLVRASFDELMAVQGTIDLLRHSVLERRAKIGTRQSSLGWDGEHYHMIELTDDAIAAQVARAEAALVFAEGLVLAPAEADTPANADTHDLFDGMHRAFLDTALAAQVEGRVLLSDDRALRAMAAATLGTPCAWTQVALQHGVQAGSIPPAAYHEAAVKLADANYTFTMFGDAEVIHVLGRSNWQQSAGLDKLIELLGRKTNDAESIRSFLAALIISAWREAPDRQAFRRLFEAIAIGMRDAQPESDVQELFQAAFDRAVSSLDSRAIAPGFRRALMSSSSMSSVEGILNRLTIPAERISSRIADELSAALDASAAKAEEKDG
ncbi:PIN domain-containing protein [Terricaulis silvestris]|uniref:PIN domain-containing protein n=1 Tax=Terricaulis silvestris TaxID=2686094 RepID=A0A6I6MG03_9CAUL|nr:hypothetical protein [Terricaulis silvestris]QGZ93525.1 hypothetical protein DSM104635_00337 [Terricaulis silvestris]